jgi:ATP-dependent RNA helicase DeaD
VPAPAAKASPAPAMAPKPPAVAPKPPAAAPAAPAAPVVAPPPPQPRPERAEASAPTNGHADARPGRDGGQPTDRGTAERSSDPPTQPRPRVRGDRRQRTEVEGPTIPPVPRMPRLGHPERSTDVALEGAPDEASDSPVRSDASPDGGELFVSVGRKDGARASDFYSVLQERAGITIDDTEYVNVRQRHTFIGLRQELIQRALDALNGAVIAGREATAERSRSRA